MPAPARKSKVAPAAKTTKGKVKAKAPAKKAPAKPAKGKVKAKTPAKPAKAEPKKPRAKAKVVPIAPARKKRQAAAKKEVAAKKSPTAKPVPAPAKAPAKKAQRMSTKPIDPRTLYATTPKPRRVARPAAVTPVQATPAPVRETGLVTFQVLVNPRGMYLPFANEFEAARLVKVAGYRREGTIQAEDVPAAHRACMVLEDAAYPTWDQRYKLFKP